MYTPQEGPDGRYGARIIKLASFTFKDPLLNLTFCLRPNCRQIPTLLMICIFRHTRNHRKKFSKLSEIPFSGIYQQTISLKEV